jgi:poly(3-hydroxybutyrate) depolymerase
VTTSIDYRLRSGNLGQAITDAQHDAQAAVRWLRRHADQYRIDPERIAIGGTSAGAITALYVGNHAEDPGTSGNPEFRSGCPGHRRRLGLRRVVQPRRRPCRAVPRHEGHRPQRLARREHLS